MAPKTAPKIASIFTIKKLSKMAVSFSKLGFGAILGGIFGVIFLLLNWALSQPVAAAPHLPFAWFARLAASALPAVLSLGLPLPSSGAQFRRECCCDGRWRRRRRGRERPKSLFLFFPLSTFPLFTERRRKEGRPWEAPQQATRRRRSTAAG